MDHVLILILATLKVFPYAMLEQLIYKDSFEMTSYKLAGSSSLEEILEEIQDPKLISSVIANDASSKTKLLAASRKLTSALEQPDDVLNYAQFWVRTP